MLSWEFPPASLAIQWTPFRSEKCFQDLLCSFHDGRVLKPTFYLKVIIQRFCTMQRYDLNMQRMYTCGAMCTTRWLHHVEAVNLVMCKVV